jgi:hypothetical protein
MAIRRNSDEPVSRYEFMQAWQARRKAWAQKAIERNEQARNAMTTNIANQASNMVQLSEIMLRNKPKVDKKA